MVAEAASGGRAIRSGCAAAAEGGSGIGVRYGLLMPVSRSMFISLLMMCCCSFAVSDLT